MGHPPRIEDAAYHRADGTPLLGRLYRPAGEGPFPAVVDVHGGAWTSGDRLKNEVIHHALAAAGVAVWALDFRAAPQARYPAPIAEINLGIRWLKARAADLGLDAARIGGLGTSSGGHQLMSTALRPHDPRYAALPLPGEVQPDARLAFVALGWPVLDPLARFRMAQERSLANLLDAHRAYWPSEDDMAEGNPQLVVERGEATALPPVLIVQGDADDNLTPDMAERFVAAYRRAGGAAELAKFADQRHTFITVDPSSAAAQAAVARIVAFVRERAGLG